MGDRTFSSRIKEMRDSIRGTKGSPLGEAAKRPKPMKKTKSESVAQPVRTKKKINSEDSGYKGWLKDVSEAVDYFIGMEIDVLPRMPWEKWYRSGVSPVKAAKQAVEMYEDSDDDEAFDFSSDVEFDKAPPELGEGFRLGRMPYHQWAEHIDKRLAKFKTSLRKLQAKRGFSNSDLLSWYNAGYQWVKVANALLEPTNKSFELRTEESRVRTSDKVHTKLIHNMGALAEVLGMDLGKGHKKVLKESEKEEDLGDEDVESRDAQADDLDVMSDDVYDEVDDSTEESDEDMNDNDLEGSDSDNDSESDSEE